MTLQDDLLRKGYLPEAVPPFFTTELIADYFESSPPSDYITKPKSPDRLRAATFSASKRGMARRPFAAVHPVTAHDTGRFIASNLTDFESVFATSSLSLSVPKHDPTAQRAVVISSHSELERARIERLAGYRFVAKTDISRFYHSIYTHSIPWAAHGKAQSKADMSPLSTKIVCNRLDQIVRSGQDGQTIGIPVGPDTSRFVAELIGTAIDVAFEKKCDVLDYAVVRHVDDVFIGAHTYVDAEKALSRYREAIREFELDINETKTHIYSSEFRFADSWPSEVSSKIKFALDSTARREDRLRSALEDIFAMAVASGDDGILRYAIRILDSGGVNFENWETTEPFLKRCAVHFGHAIDLATRVLVWQDVASFDLTDMNSWSPIFIDILDRHGRLGNDSEACWAIYACYRFKIPIPKPLAENVVRNCGALTLVALLNGVEEGIVDASVFEVAAERLALEDARGAFWPVFLEWMIWEWPNFASLKSKLMDDTVAALAEAGASIFDETALPSVFHGVDPSDFGKVKYAIEPSESYDDDGDGDEIDPG